MPNIMSFESFYRFTSEKKVVVADTRNEKRIFNAVYYLGGLALYPILKNTKLLNRLKNIIHHIFLKEKTETRYIPISDKKIFLNITTSHTEDLTNSNNPKQAQSKIKSVVKNVLKVEEKTAGLVIQLEALLYNVERDFGFSLDKDLTKYIRNKIKNLIHNDLSKKELKKLEQEKISSEFLQLIRERDHSSSSSLKNELHRGTLDDPLCWPSDNDFGLKEEQRNEIEKFINHNRNTFKKEFSENDSEGYFCFLKDIETDEETGGFTPCRTVYVLNSDVIIDVEEVVAFSQGQSFNKYYGLISQEYFALKSLPEDDVGRTETSNAYEQLKGKPGCLPYAFVVDKNVFEPLYECTLSEQLSHKVIQTTAEKVEVVSQIAKGLLTIHSCVNTLSAITILPNEGKLVRSWSGPLSHNNLNFDKIFIRTKEGKVQRHLGWYESVGTANHFMCNGGLISPQVAQFFLNPRDSKDLVFFNHAFGERNDMWQFGVIIASILKNEFSPLQFLKDVIGISREEEARYMQELLQSTIDKEINQEKVDVEQSDLPPEEKKVMVRCWNLVNQLLQVNANKRPHIASVLKKLKKAKAFM